MGGEEDFVFDVDENCWRSNWCPDEAPNNGGACVVGELVTRTTEFADLVEASPSPTIYEVYLSRCDTVPPPSELDLLGETGEERSGRWKGSHGAPCTAGRSSRSAIVAAPKGRSGRSAPDRRCGSSFAETWTPMALRT